MSAVTGNAPFQLPALRRTRDLIDRDDAEPLDLDAMARAAGYSRLTAIRGLRHRSRLAPRLKVALACPGAIAEIDASSSLTALQGLQRSVRHGSLLREVGKAIDALAGAKQISRSELLETAVERHELDHQGRRELPIGDWTAALQVTGSGEVETSWIDPHGEPRASLPKSIKDADPGAVKQVAVAAKAIRDTIASERVRLDRLFTEDRRWPLAEWRSRYLEHPITGMLARSLIWHFGPVIGMPSIDGASATDASGASLPVPDDVEVALWHPIEATDDLIRAWRERLMSDRFRQPLKQAFRELYVVTPAELETRTYSNRFASHVIRQVQARALMKGRGWSPVAVAWWDDGIDVGVARRTLEAHGVRAEFFYDPITDIAPATSDLYPYCRATRCGSSERARRTRWTLPMCRRSPSPRSCVTWTCSLA